MWSKGLWECFTSQLTFWQHSSWDTPLPVQRKYYHLGQCFHLLGCHTKVRLWSCSHFSDKTPLRCKWAVATPEQSMAEAEPAPLETVVWLCSFIDGSDRFQAALDVSPVLVPILWWPAGGKNHFWQKLGLHSRALEVIWRNLGTLLGPFCWHYLRDVATVEKE